MPVCATRSIQAARCWSRRVWDWITSLFASTATVLAVPDFHVEDGFLTTRFIFATPVTACFCAPYAEREDGSFCPEEGGGDHFTLTATDRATDESDTMWLATRFLIDGREVIATPPALCFEKAAFEPVTMTLTSQRGYPIQAGKAKVELR